MLTTAVQPPGFHSPVHDRYQHYPDTCFDTACDYTLQFIIQTHFTSLLLLLCSGFQWWTFFFPCVPKLSIYQLLTLTAHNSLNPSSSVTNFNSELVLVILLQNGPCRNIFYYCCVLSLPCKNACLQSCYLAIAVI
jgi:hypothetical protein